MEGGTRLIRAFKDIADEEEIVTAEPVFRKPRYLGSILILVLLGIAMLVGVIHCSIKIRQEVRSSAFNTLRVASMESSKAVAQTLQSRVDYLNSVWLMMSEGGPETYSDVIISHHNRRDIYRFERLGYADRTGMGVNSTGEVKSLARGTVFQESIAGHIAVGYRTLKDENGEPYDVVVLSIPVYEDGDTEPSGVLYQIFSMEAFASLLDTETFDGLAETAFIIPSGAVVSATSGSMHRPGENIIECLSADGENGEFVEKLESALADTRSGGGVYDMDGEQWYAFYQPMVIADSNASLRGGLLIDVPERYIQHWTNSIYTNVLIIIALVGLFLFLLFGGLIGLQRKSAQELEELAYQDPVTGEPNYEAFKHEFSKQRHWGGVLIAFDFVNYKLVNRHQGSRSGTGLLTETARLLTSLGSNVISARVMDDNYILFYPGMDIKDAAAKCQELYEQLMALMEELHVHESSPVFGYCPVDGALSLERYRSRAIFAKNIAKQDRVISRAYDEQVTKDYTESLRLLSSFEEAVQEGRFEVWYQPKRQFDSSKLCGAEALVRWRREDGELLPPGRFLSLLEPERMSVLDEYVFAAVCDKQKQWQERGFECVPISVNISRSSLLDTTLPARYSRIVEESGIAKNLVQLEITEEAVEENVLDAVKALKSEGFVMLMDDFGRGSSNLAGVRRDLFDGIKFDKSLIDLIGTGEEAVLGSTLHMIQSVGMRITAEGVERPEQAQYLEEMSCDELQGFLYHRPMNAGSFELLLKLEEYKDE